MTGTLTGGSPITSYQIDWDMRTNAATWETLQGFNSNSLSLSLIKTGLLTSEDYYFRYRAKNIFGWGEWSDSSPIETIMLPEQPDPI